MMQYAICKNLSTVQGKMLKKELGDLKKRSRSILCSRALDVQVNQSQGQLIRRSSLIESKMRNKEETDSQKSLH